MTLAPVIHWFRRDLRLADNTALTAALESGAPVVPVFIFDPALLDSERVGLPRLALILKALHALNEGLRAYNTRLVIRRGKPQMILKTLMDETGAAAIYFNRDYSPFARQRDDALKITLGIPAHGFDDLLIHAPGDVLKADGDPYTVFTPFKKRWLTLPKPASPKTGRLPGSFHGLDGIESGSLPTLRDLGFDETIDVPDASETHARRMLARFASGGIYDYQDGRNRLIANPFDDPRSATSALSPYLRLGMLSPRQAFHAAQQAKRAIREDEKRASVDTWVSELVWREFYVHILHHFPYVLRRNFKREYDAVPFRHAPDELAAWQDGMTGYPVVDAAMRQLKAIGWMPNRARMIVASFLTKDLLIGWWDGERHFMRWLLDGDPAANNGGWQWSASTGTDAQPYFRVFNPVGQGRKFDPTGDYVRTWVPELRDVPDDYLHTPWEMMTPVKSYRLPIIDHTFARVRAVNAFRIAREIVDEPQQEQRNASS